MANNQNSSTLVFTPWAAELVERGHLPAPPPPSDVGAAYSKTDPLSWSWKKKHLVLAAVCYMTFMTDFLAGYGVPMIIPQAKEWKLSPADSTRSLSGNTFTQGFGSLIAVPFAKRYGTLPVMFWSTFITFFMTLACALCPDNWIGFIAIRAVQGFFATTGQVLGMTVIQDIFFFEEHVQKLGIWGWSILIGPYFGPFLASFIISTQTWRTAFGICTAFVGLGLILIIFLMDETTFDRTNPGNNPPRPKTYWKYKAQTLSGIYGYRAKGKPTLRQGCYELWNVFRTPQFYILFFSHGVTYMWSVGINGSLVHFLVRRGRRGYGFSSVNVGLIYFAPMIAVVLGQIWGHFMNYVIQAQSIRQNRGFFQPEVRLWATYMPAVLCPLGLLLFGSGLHRFWHWGYIAVFWGLYICCLMINTVVISAYVLDCFPNNSAAASALLNFTRVLHGFLVPFFEIKWARAIGVDRSFVYQAAICFAASLLVVLVQMYGKRWRKESSLSPDFIFVIGER